jgi:hypothetical protein
VRRSQSSAVRKEAIVSKRQVLGALFVGALGGTLLSARPGSFGLAATLCAAFALSDALSPQRGRDGLLRAAWQGASLGGLVALSFLAFSR